MGRLSQPPLSLPEQFAVRSQPDKLERFRVWLPIDQQQIRAYMAFTVIGPIAGESMIPVGCWQEPVSGQPFEQRGQERV